MNTFKQSVAGPYQPVIPVKGRWWRKPKVATAGTAIQLFHTYYSIISWRGHDEAMARSMRHANVMMGEIDEPDESERPPYSPLASAGWFALGLVNERLAKLDTPISRAEKICLEAALLQVLCALRDDDEAMAQIALCERTGYLGKPTDADKAQVPEIRKMIRAIIRKNEQIEDAFEKQLFDVPLMTRNCYSAEDNRYYWSDPILVPEVDVDEEIEEIGEQP